MRQQTGQNTTSTSKHNYIVSEYGSGSKSITTTKTDTTNQQRVYQHNESSNQPHTVKSKTITTATKPQTLLVPSIIKQLI